MGDATRSDSLARIRQARQLCDAAFAGRYDPLDALRGTLVLLVRVEADLRSEEAA